MEIKDTYKTLDTPSGEILFKEKNSKFFGYAFPIKTEEEAKSYIEELKKKHSNARHWCYAYQIGTEKVIFRANDDGEPNNTAGMPIYGQIQSFELTNTLVVIVRYFGASFCLLKYLIQRFERVTDGAYPHCRSVAEATIGTGCARPRPFDKGRAVTRVWVV